MIIQSSESLQKLNEFFMNSLSELSIPELVRMDVNDSNYTMWNGLVLNNSNLKRIELPNMEQSPYLLMGNNLTEVDLEHLLQVEFGLPYVNSLSNFPTRFLQNTKIRTLYLPNFKGTARPLPQGTDDIANSQAELASFWNNYWLTDVSLGNSKMNNGSSVITGTEYENFKFNGFWFRNNYSLRFLRLNYPFVIPLVRTAGFNTTPIGSGDGYIYVPDNLLEEYQTKAENWISLQSKIRAMSSYEDDLAQYSDTITDSWETIIENCQKGNIGQYNIGGKKTVMIDGVPSQFVIVGKRKDPVAETNVNYTDQEGNPATTAALSWVETTISRFKTVSVSGTFDSTKPRQYAYATNFRSKITAIYSGIEDTVKSGIKAVKKYSKGFNEANNVNQLNRESIETGVWPLSATELGLTQQAGTNLPDYTDYFTSMQKIKYCLGATNINTEPSGTTKIHVALRDYSNESSSYPDLLRATDNTNEPMEIVYGSSTNPYLIVGFCT